MSRRFSRWETPRFLLGSAPTPPRILLTPARTLLGIAPGIPCVQGKKDVLVGIDTLRKIVNHPDLLARSNRCLPHATPRACLSSPPARPPADPWRRISRIYSSGRSVSGLVTERTTELRSEAGSFWCAWLIPTCRKRNRYRVQRPERNLWDILFPRVMQMNAGRGAGSGAVAAAGAPRASLHPDAAGARALCCSPRSFPPYVVRSSCARSPSRGLSTNQQPSAEPSALA